MPSFAGLTKFFGRTASEGAAFAAGVAVAPALSPVVREIVNEANSKYQTHPIDAETAAAIVAEDVERFDFGRAEASFNGVSEERFRALLGEALNAPGVPLLLTLWRRDEISDADFVHGLRKAKLEGRWDTPLRELKTERLDPAQIALGIVRSIFADPGLLAVSLDTSDSNVPRYKPLDIDALAEAAASGIDRERLRGMVGEIGLPMPVVRAANAYFRSIITRGAYNLAVLEGDTRPEWADALLDEARQIPTVHDGIEGRLRGWLRDDEMYAQTARHGMSEEDTDLLFKITGRPLAFHQAFIGHRRGGELDGSIDDIPEYFLKALRESNIRPEWYSLAWAQRFTYPTSFVLRALTEAGDLTQAETEAILLYEGWEPTLAKKVSERWAGATGGASAGPSKKAQTALLTALHRSYVATEIDGATVRENLTLLGVDAAEQQKVIDLWSAERSFVRKQLSPAEIRKLTAKGDVNLATGQPWTTQEAVAALLERGYSADEARMFLEL